MDSVSEDHTRPCIRGALYGMAACEGLASRRYLDDAAVNRLNSFQLNIEPITAATLCITDALLEKNGYSHDKFGYVEKLLQWLKGPQSPGSSMCIPRGLAAALAAWDREMAVALVMGKGPKQGEDIWEKSERFIEMQKAINEVLATESHQDAIGLAFTVPVALELIPEDWLDESMLRSWAMSLSSIVNPHEVNKWLASLFSELINSALACSPDGEPKRATILGATILHSPEKLDKNLLAYDFAGRVYEVKQRTSHIRGKVSGLLKRLQPYNDLEAWKARPLSSLKDTAFALDIFEAVLWCFFTTDTLQEGNEKTEHFQADRGTIGALYGALAGAFYGYDAIPADWVNKIPAQNRLESALNGIFRLRDKQSEF